MLRNRAVIALLLFGFLSFGMLTYFYFAQRSFSYNQRYFLIHLNNLDNLQSDLTNEVLKSSLFAYNSHDKIAYDYDAMQRELTLLQDAKILHNKPYAKLKKKIDTELQNQINAFLLQIQDFLLLNAAVKNSLVFLASHVQYSDYVQKKDPKLYIQAVKILNRFKNVRKMQDLDYLHQMHYLLKSNTKDKEIRSFIKTFNLHANYLTKKLPAFIIRTKTILNNKLPQTLDQTRHQFDKITLDDFLFYDRFASIVALLLVGYLFLALYLFSRYQKTNRSLTYSLSHDHLTDLYDRSSFIKDTAQIQTDKTLLLLNIDAFKAINDVYGNEFGNKVLIHLTKYLKEYFHTTNNIKLYRVGGDEFAMLFRDKPADEALKIANDLVNTIKNSTFTIDGIHINLSVSIAVNTTPPLLENADLALKVIKKDMNRRVILYKEELSVKKEWKKNIEIVNIVKAALKEDRIVPYFQGIVNLNSMKIEKYEALVRLVLPSGEVLSPYFFLDVVSKTHYYYDITETMIKKTIEVAKEYPQYRFSINFSMRDIINIDIANTLFSLFDADRQTAARVDIELLETELVAFEDNRINDFIAKIHSYGSKVLIDDFGTGYSNFSYLSDLNVDIIKIDASITKEITTNPKKLHILKSIHNFTHGMGMLNVAEFVETKEIAEKLQEIGVEYAQGYLFSKPLPKPLENSSVTL